MEYKLNKIDTELRQKINDETKEGKVHGTKNIAINKDKPKHKEEKEKYKIKKYNTNTRIIVEVSKAENIEIEAFKADIDTGDIRKGTIIDTKI